MGEDILKRLVNPPLSLEWDGKQYEVKKANLSQVIQYRTRLNQYVESKEAAADQKLAGYCLWLILKDHIPGLTEEQVLENVSGEIGTSAAGVLALLTELGFVSPEKETAIPTEVQSPPTTESSS